MTLFLHSLSHGRIQKSLWKAGEEIPDGTIWFDLLAPTPREEQVVEEHLRIDVPTRDEMREIEVSNRLYAEHGHVFMTATLVAKFDTDEPENQPVTFIVSPRHMVTIRYSDSVPFRMFTGRVERMKDSESMGAELFVTLLESIINRAADILEKIGQDIDLITKQIFCAREGEQPPKINFQLALERIGYSGDITSKARESLASLMRAVSYASMQQALTIPGDNLSRFASERQDIAGLIDHAVFLANKVNFLLDATLGMISMEQNKTFRVLSVASLIFLPPTLVAGIYGMNFKFLPELEWHYGYPIALGIMLVAAILPLAYLKQKKWL